MMNITGKAIADLSLNCHENVDNITKISLFLKYRLNIFFFLLKYLRYC